MDTTDTTVVIDNGTGVLKAGFAGHDKPKTTFNSCVGRIKHKKVMANNNLDGDIFIGSSVEKYRGAFKITYPIESGIVRDWGDMEKIWSYVYNRDCLAVQPEEHPVLLTEAPLNPYANREKAAEIFFEQLNVPALYFSVQAILGLYASGRTTGVVLDSGDGVTHVVPVYEGLAIPHAIMRMDLAGRNITEYLQLLLRRSGHIFQTSTELEVVRQLKEKLCVVSTVPLSSHEAETQAQATVKYPFELPDGSVVEMGAEAYRAPEILFQPDLIGSEYRGIHDCLVKSIMKTDMDLRRVLCSEIVLSGGSTMFNGFGERLLSEVRKHQSAPKDTKIRIAAPPERLHSTWIGGSILASLSTFKNMWISKQEYHEQGSRVLFSKQQL
eukprot:gene10648-14300_t